MRLSDLSRLFLICSRSKISNNKTKKNWPDYDGEHECDRAHIMRPLAEYGNVYGKWEKLKEEKKKKNADNKWKKTFKQCRKLEEFSPSWFMACTYLFLQFFKSLLKVKLPNQHICVTISRPYALCMLQLEILNNTNSHSTIHKTWTGLIRT